MSEKLREIGRKVADQLNSENEQIRRRWQAIVGVAFMFLFVVTSVLVNRAVFAVNQAAGNYGYRGGGYAFYGTSTSSDALPSAPTSFSASSIGTSSATISWTAPTTTVRGTNIATGSGSIGRYLINYGTSSLSTCSGGTSTESTSTSLALSNLSTSTTYYVAVCAEDNNLNNSAALTGSFATAAAGGGGSGAGGGGGAASVFTAPAAPAAAPAAVSAAPAVPTTGAPTPITTPAVAPTVAQSATALVAHLVSQGIAAVLNTAAEATNSTKVTSSATEFRVTIITVVKTVAANFVTYGTSSVTVALGSGERLAVVRDLFDTLGSTVAGDASKLLLAAEQISNGQKPTVRNLTKERGQVSDLLPAFKALTGKAAPNFKNAKDDLAWNTMLYRVRFKRDLAKERSGIQKFRATFKKTPKTPRDWAVVRAWAYALK